MTILAIVNQKGGVGKTTTTVNLAHWFAMHGKRVLIVDFDVQGHAATCLGAAKSDGLFRLLVGGADLKDVAVSVRENLDLVASNKQSEKIKVYLNDVSFRELYIAQILEQASDYDYVLLDLAPGSDVLHVAALVASDAFVVPAKMDYLALDGCLEVIRTVQSLGKISNVQAPELIGILPTMYDRMTLETNENLKRLGEMVGMEQVLPPVPVDTHIREATSRGLTIWEYAPGSSAAIGFTSEGGKSVNSRGRVGGYLHLAEIIEEMTR